jgi:branched-chain amino acid transport system permease protein
LKKGTKKLFPVGSQADTWRQLGLVLVCFFAALVLPWVARPDLVTLGSQIFIYGIAAVSLDLLIGYTGLSSFGHAAFFGLGAYVVGILASHAAEGTLFLGVFPGTTQAWIVWPSAILVAALAALAIGALSLRTAGVQFIMITLAFAEMVYFLFVSLKKYGGDDGLGFRRRSAIPGLDPRDDVAFYYVCLAALVLFLLLCRKIVRSRFGLVLQGIRQNERRMAAIGVATYRYKLAVFVIAGGGAGLAGALDANLLRFVSPDLLHWTTSGDLMVMVVVGGAGSLIGAVFGAALMIALQSFLAQWTEHWMIVMGPFLVLFILTVRRGLWGFLGGKT